MSQPKIWGLSNDVQHKLREVAVKIVHKPSISALAKYLLLKELNTSTPNIQNRGNISQTCKKHRLELQLTPIQYNYLRTSAEQHSMTANAYAVDILNYHITHHPTLSNSEAEALYQSNYQLLRIGRNLNQIARQLNIGESSSITAEEIRQLLSFIEKHTEKVNDVMLASQKRFE